MDHFFDIAYKTKSGQFMLAKCVVAKNASRAKRKLKAAMRSTTNFDKIIMVTTLR